LLRARLRVRVQDGTVIDADVAVRNLTYALFVEFGRAPTVTEVASRSGIAAGDAGRSWRRLHDAHALVLEPDGETLLMANPFSAVPTPYRVTAGGRSWYGNCAWDAFGICAALHVDGRIETTCLDCGDPIDVTVVDERPHDDQLVFHCLVPAAQWWDDIGFT
jgi:hypothetical protein